jgi:uncharacterized protein (DUF1800 family)
MRAMVRNASANSSSADSASDAQQIKQIRRDQGRVAQQLNASRVARAVGSERQLLEVMTEFWENHFNVYVRKGGPEPYYLVEFDHTIREHALGKFRDLLGAVAHSPAMLYYLDNAQSRANPGAPTLQNPRQERRARAAQMRATQANAKLSQPKGLNENYGRELLELHTLGVDGGYTQQDVINVARALTGWSIRVPRQGGGFVFRPEWHDAGTKVVLGHTLPAGRGEADGEEVLDILARSPATAHFIAFKLARHFVSDTPPATLVDRAAQKFLASDGDIREVVRTIVTSPEFFSRAAFRQKVKSPFEVVVSTARALDARPDTTPRSALLVASLGQPLFGHQAPDGWPETGDAWMNTGAILARINFGQVAAANRIPGATLAGAPWVDSIRAAPRARQVDAVIRHILGGQVSSETWNVLMTGTNPLAAAKPSPAGNAAMDMTEDAMENPGAMAAAGRRTPRRGAPPKLAGLAQIIGLALGSPEFQRR